MLFYLVAKKTDLDSYQCLVFAILTHGDNGWVYGTNTKFVNGDHQPRVAIKQILLKFNAANCRALRGKPKIFIIQVFNESFN